MTKILLKIELGSWDGVNDGYYPKIIEWNLNDQEYPFSESEGWGHGFGGGNSTLESFKIRNELENLKNGESHWAYIILKNAIESNQSVEEIGNTLTIESQKNIMTIPEKLRSVLRRSKNYLNV